jgi:hypothetical protein
MTGVAAARLPTHLVDLAVRLLPSARRDRYRQELTAELLSLPREEQRAYALRILARTWALRAALDTREHDTIGATTMTKRQRCTLRLHSWQTRRNEEGEPYQACTRCPAERESFVMTNSMGPSGDGGGGVGF